MKIVYCRKSQRAKKIDPVIAQEIVGLYVLYKLFCGWHTMAILTG